MKYEIITDNEDLLVLVLNSRVIEVSHSMSKILDVIESNYIEFMGKKIKTPNKTATVAESPESHSLGKLFGL
jgi:hypothetical protein